jgi:hypothetical protein
MPSLQKIIAEAKVHPGAWLEQFTAIALDQLISGFRSADSSSSQIMDHLQAMLQQGKTSQMSPLVRLHLDHQDFEVGARSAIHFLEEVITQRPGPPIATPLVHRKVIPALIDAVEQGRPGLYLSEPSLTCLVHFIRGHIAALEQFESNSALQQQSEIDEFETRVRSEYSEPTAPWQRILSVYEGPGPSGLKVFARMWRSWIG